MEVLLLSQLFEPFAWTLSIVRIFYLEFGDYISFICEQVTSVRFDIVFALLMGLRSRMPAFSSVQYRCVCLYRVLESSCMSWY